MKVFQTAQGKEDRTLYSGIWDLQPGNNVTLIIYTFMM
jgi:hypothetical protein